MEGKTKTGRCGVLSSVRGSLHKGSLGLERKERKEEKGEKG